MKLFTVFMIMIVNFFIQSTWLQHFRLLDIIPNTTLIIVVVFSILWGKKKGATIGFFAGMLQDILLGSMIGANALVYMLVGYNIGIFEKNIYKDNHITPVLFTIAGTVSYHLLYYVIMYLTKHTFDFVFIFRKVVLIEMIYNSIVSIFIYRWIYKITQYPYMKAKIR
ncbi:rod shape-determining protein MreD [Inediibacterium massiliense]|uniref:rod shape-determining protein MreD n=1 Tax=Inediibacterium massiliense TaxID=1658111 RepID=UPI0006B44966|nr:rod shape-determining protein MreD [Inediibacterium massiliense]